MPQFLYFIPGADPVATPELCRRAGLAYALDRDSTVNSLRTSAGPDGLPGLLLTIDGPAPVGYDAKGQSWRKCEGGTFHLGLIKGQAPTPSDLARKKFIAGETVELSDGNEWTVPICFSIVRRSSLPKSLVLGEDNQSWVLEELPEFLALCRDAATVWTAFQTAEKGTVSIDGPEAIRIATDALAVNYRLSKYEISALRLIDTQSMWRVLKIIVDMPEVERVYLELQKKTSPSAG